MASLSLCMIVKDESDFLKQCLEDAKPFVDEIIIVDTGSEDNTIEIAKSFGAKVFEHKWNNNFSDARNISLKHATKDWILVLDADETISKSDLKKIKELIDNPEFDAYSIIQRNYFRKREPTAMEVSSKHDAYKESEGYRGWFPSILIRLFRNNKGYEFTGLIHELIEPSIKQIGGKIFNSQIPIHHFRVEKGKRIDIEKKQKYLEIGKKQIELTPNNPKPYYEVGTIYLSDKKYDKAIQLFEKSVKVIENSDKPEQHEKTLVYVYYGLGKAYLQAEKYEDAIKCFEKVLVSNPKAHVLHFLLAQSYTMLNRFNEAVKEYRIAARLNPNDEEIHNNLANLYSRTGQFDNAVKEFKIAISLFPKNATIHRNLGATYLGMKKWAGAYEMFKKSVELNPEFEKDLGEVIKKLEVLKDQTDVDYSFSVG